MTDSVRTTLDRRFEEIKRGQVTPERGDEVFERVRRKSEERRRDREWRSGPRGSEDET